MVLCIAAMLLLGTTVQAADQKHRDQQDRVTKRYRQAQPISFIERGVKFFVYPNGEIDFRFLNRRSRSRNVDWNDRRYNAPGSYGYYNRPAGTKYDYYGRLKKVGVNYINYDRYDRVRRIGSIILRYNRRGLVNQIGGLHIYYNRYAKIRHVEGNVHFDGCEFCGAGSCNVPHDPYFNQNRRLKQYNQDDDYYKNRKRKKRHDDDDDDDD